MSVADPSQSVPCLRDCWDSLIPAQSVPCLRDSLIYIVIDSGAFGISGKISKITNFTNGALYGVTFRVVNIATIPVFRKIAEYTDRTKTVVLSRLAVNLTATALITSKVLEVNVAASAGTMLSLMATTLIVACGVRGTLDIGKSIYAKCHA